MTLVQLTIGHACTRCRACEKYLPGLLEDVDKNGYGLVNPLNPHADLEAVADAMLACEVGALSVGTV